jgi:glycosyltransferase involved in cell wall biosynthesis
LKSDDLFRTVVPSKIFEAMALGTPIIMGVQGEALTMVAEARAGLPMTPDDPDSLIRCIDTIARNRQRYGQGRGYVAARFSRDSLAESMLVVLRTVAEGSGAIRLPEPEAVPDAARKAA